MRAVKILIIVILLLNATAVYSAQKVKVDSLIKEAKHFSVKGNFSEARKKYQEVIKRFPESKHSEEAYFWTGYFYEAEGIIDKAEFFYKEFMEKYPKSIFADDTLRKWASIHVDRRNYIKASEILHRLVSVYPESSYTNKANAELGDIYGYHLDEFNKAVDYYKKYKADDVSSEEIKIKIAFFKNNQDYNSDPLKMYCLAKRQSESGELEKTKKTLEKLILDFPKSKVVDESLILLGRNEIGKAVRMLKVNPTFSSEGKNIFLGYYKSAAGYFNQVIRDYPKNETSPQAKYYLAQIYDWDRIGGLNDFEKAMKAYLEVIEEYPDSYWAKKAKDRLEVLKEIF